MENKVLKQKITNLTQTKEDNKEVENNLKFSEISSQNLKKTAEVTADVDEKWSGFEVALSKIEDILSEKTLQKDKVEKQNEIVVNKNLLQSSSARKLRLQFKQKRKKLKRQNTFTICKEVATQTNMPSALNGGKKKKAGFELDNKIESVMKSILDTSKGSNASKWSDNLKGDKTKTRLLNKKISSKDGILNDKRRQNQRYARKDIGSKDCLKDQTEMTTKGEVTPMIGCTNNVQLNQQNHALILPDELEQQKISAALSPLEICFFEDADDSLSKLITGTHDITNAINEYIQLDSEIKTVKLEMDKTVLNSGIKWSQVIKPVRASTHEKLTNGLSNVTMINSKESQIEGDVNRDENRNSHCAMSDNKESQKNEHFAKKDLSNIAMYRKQDIKQDKIPCNIESKVNNHVHKDERRNSDGERLLNAAEIGDVETASFNDLENGRSSADLEALKTKLVMVQEENRELTEKIKQLKKDNSKTLLELYLKKHENESAEMKLGGLPLNNLNTSYPQALRHPLGCSPSSLVYYNSCKLFHTNMCFGDTKNYCCYAKPCCPAWNFIPAGRANVGVVDCNFSGFEGVEKGGASFYGKLRSLRGIPGDRYGLQNDMTGFDCSDIQNGQIYKASNSIRNGLMSCDEEIRMFCSTNNSVPDAKCRAIKSSTDMQSDSKSCLQPLSYDHHQAALSGFSNVAVSANDFEAGKASVTLQPSKEKTSIIDSIQGGIHASNPGINATKKCIETSNATQHVIAESDSNLCVKSKQRTIPEPGNVFCEDAKEISDKGQRFECQTAETCHQKDQENDKQTNENGAVAELAAVRLRSLGETEEDQKSFDSDEELDKKLEIYNKEKVNGEERSYGASSDASSSSNQSNTRVCLESNSNIDQSNIGASLESNSNINQRNTAARLDSNGNSNECHAETCSKSAMKPKRKRWEKKPNNYDMSNLETASLEVQVISRAEQYYGDSFLSPLLKKDEFAFNDIEESSTLNAGEGSFKQEDLMPLDLRSENAEEAVVVRKAWSFTGWLRKKHAKPNQADEVAVVIQ